VPVWCGLPVTARPVEPTLPARSCRRAVSERRQDEKGNLSVHELKRGTGRS